ncbi:transcriptional regulator [Acinetobacter sp. LoGeW2-3]|uniref:MarR family winged helix-turn-helix transcriptional regulator n=1 Tax=Acinetobacter sp. LoGeW2-3 TaxID=1808001 RepID=UPI000C059E32|nr:MarR family transcriptional regulator [Acinetobacter sp. LoGeW2-3]ATO20405.1 transcriptional regulator [Acinetobacter sp. LoGeW2-3]
MDTSSRFRFALLRCARLLGDEVNAVLLEHDLNYSLWQSLVIIKMNGQCTALDIAHELQISKPAVTKRLNTLIEMNLIESLPTTDKRQKLLQLSTLGEQQFQQCSDKIDDLETELLHGFDKSQLKQAHAFILDFMNSLQSRKDQHHG